MGSSSKAAIDRRKSGGKPSLTVTLSVNASKLRELIKTETSTEASSPTAEVKEQKESPAASVNGATTNGNGEQNSESNAATPGAEGTPGPVMGPPAKKGTKRAAGEPASDNASKSKARPGPKKKPKLDDGNADGAKPSAHRLGPKANQGAINAGLRSLDRSGKPCRKWDRGGFKLKSFTGVIWEVSRWTAPPKKLPEPGTEESATTSAADNSSSKENKDAPAKGDSGRGSHSGADVEMNSTPSIHPSSPAPVPVAAAS